MGKPKLRKLPDRVFFYDEEPEDEYTWWDNYHKEMKNTCRHCGREDHQYQACPTLAVWQPPNRGSWDKRESAYDD